MHMRYIMGLTGYVYVAIMVVFLITGVCISLGQRVMKFSRDVILQINSASAPAPVFDGVDLFDGFDGIERDVAPSERVGS